MQEKKKPKPQAPLPVSAPDSSSMKLLILQWESEGVPSRYARFHQPIPRHENTEPVSEFRIGSKNKYEVDSITYTEYGVIWRSGGEINICALANVMYLRSGLK